MSKDRKKINLEELDIGHYMGSQEAKVDDKKDETVKTTDESKMIKDIKSDKIKTKKKLLTFPETYENNIKKYIEENNTPYYTMTVQSFIVQAIEEKLVKLGY